MVTRASKLVALFGLLAVAVSADARESEQTQPDVEQPQPDVDTAERVGAEAESSRLAEADPLSTTPVDEEVVVRGQMTRGALRVQIEMAEEAFYGRFNEVNSDDEFDIHCRQVVEIGSRIPRRRCEPNYWRTAQTDFAQDTLISMQGGYAGNPQEALARAHYKRIELEQEMRELAAADAGLREALARLVTLQQALGSRNEK